VNPILLKGKKVVGAEGYILGEVEGVEVDYVAWQAKAVNVNLTSDATAELGFQKSFLHKVAVSLPVQLVEAVGEVITLKAPIRKLEDAVERSILVSSNKIEGKQVIGAKGYVVGEVEGLDLNLDNWQVTGLQVALSEDATLKLGFKKPFLSKVVVIIPSSVVNHVNNFVFLNEALESLESIVECIRSCQKQS
jgi:sporulation protein YlmC with PRC-barrel domain